MTEILAQLLLRLSENRGDPILWGRAARSHFGRVFDQLLRARVLIERPPADSWSVCSTCECGLDARPIDRHGDQIIAVCPVDQKADAKLSTDDLRSFMVDAAALVAMIARASGFTGTPVQLMDGVWDAGRTAVGRGVVLVLDPHAASDPNFVVVVRSLVRANGVTVMMPASIDRTVARRFEDAGFHAAVTADAIGGAGHSTPFALDTAQLAPQINIEPDLVVHLAAQRITLFGKQTVLPERPFRLLALLARAADDRGRVVPRREIESALWSTVVDPRLVADAVRDLREHIEPFLPPHLAADMFIANRPRKGYLLSLRADQVRIDP